MRATDVWSASQRPTVSFELFPARSEKAAANLEKAIDRLAALEPDFVSVTFGAGGSMREGSRQLIEKLKVEKGLEIIAYFAGYGLGPDDIAAVLNSYQELGVENVLVVRGDPPHGDEDFTPHPDSLPHASDLLAFVRARWWRSGSSSPWSSAGSCSRPACPGCTSTPWIRADQRRASSSSCARRGCWVRSRADRGGQSGPQ